jgi:hypothetical protein
VFASTHTCLAVMRDFQLRAGRLTIVNNGWAGMPNFSGAPEGLVSRIATTPSPHRSLYGIVRDGIHIDTIRVAYDSDAFLDRFLARWPEGSAAHVSYFDRITAGPDHSPARATPSRFTASPDGAIAGLVRPAHHAAGISEPCPRVCPEIVQ